MVAIGAADFSTMLPLRDPVLLPDNYAQQAVNVWAYKGTLRGFRLSVPQFILARPATSKQVYRIPITAPIVPDFTSAGSLWLEFPDEYMSVIPTPVVGDQFNRYYFFPSEKFVADGGPWPSVPFYAPLANLQNAHPGPLYTLGVPNPTVAPGVSAPPETIANLVTNASTSTSSNVLHFASTTGVSIGMEAVDNTSPSAISPAATVTSITTTTVTMSDTMLATVNSGDSITFSTVAEVRAYVYTWVSAYGEEGPPSPATQGTGNPLGTWNITMTPPTGAQTTNRNLTKVRIYRTITDSNGNASYYQVVELPIATTSYADNNLDTTVINNRVLPSVTFSGPPAGLQGVVLMANGILAGWTNQREVWFSAAYQPHAWPATYAITVDYPIVGLAAVGSSLCIMTEFQPFIATGTTPDTMTIGKVTANEPCISRGSIFAAGEGVYYASLNGLILINTMGTTNVTLYSMEREFWNAQHPELWAAGRMSLSYFAFQKYAPASGVAVNGIVLDHLEKNVPCSLINSSHQPIVNVYNDQSGYLFYISEGVVRQINPPSGGGLLPWAWKSKKFRMQRPQQIKAFKINFSVPPEVTIPPPTTPNTDQSQTYDPTKQYLTVTVFADGKPIVIRDIIKDNLIVTIPGGFKATYWEFLFQGQVYVFLFKAASSIKELVKA